MPKLTIGMAHFEDYDGVYFTIQSIRMHHPEILKDVEFVVVDNSPQTQSGDHVQRIVKGFVGLGSAGAIYHPMDEVVGTSASRETIFKVATGDAVLVLDCHVLLDPGSLKRLIDFYDDNPETRDIYSGPLVYDSMTDFTTHFNDQWRGEMWGTWGSAWKAEDDDGNITYFSVMEEEPGNPNSAAQFVSLDMGPVPITQAGKHEPFPSMPWVGHQHRLFELGFTYAGKDPDEPPFAIPGQGLGLFSCRREAWQGFHPHAQGFGGEELYIHEKFRQQGAKAVCLPFLRWLHRFARPNGVKFPLTRYNKVRNYVLEFQELGRDVGPIHDHFVKSGLMMEQTWKHLMADPVANVDESKSGCSTCGGKVSSTSLDKLNQMNSIDEVFAVLQAIPRDLDQHLPKLKELAEQCDHITEFSQRRESTSGFLAGRPKTLVSHNTEWDEVQMVGESMVADQTKYVHTLFRSHMVDEIDETDLLFLDSTHTRDYINTEFEKFAHKVKRFIVVHDTLLYGERGEDGGPGVLVGMRDFMKANPEWSVIFHTPDQYGLTVLGRLDEDKPKLPSKMTMAKNLIRAVADHVADGAQKASDEIYEERLLTCSMCPHRRDNRCTVCGCFVEKKAAWKESECPIGLWMIEETEVEKGDQKDD